MDKFNNFDWKTYIQNYEDLRKAGINNQSSAIRHWIKFGEKEGRTYRSINQDISTNEGNNTPITNNNDIIDIMNIINSWKKSYDCDDITINFKNNENIKII